MNKPTNEKIKNAVLTGHLLRDIIKIKITEHNQKTNNK